MRPITQLIVHHSASPRDTTTPGLIAQWHQARGWDAVGYHFMIDAMGHIHQGRHWSRVGAHAKGWNSKSIGVCVIGNNCEPGERWTQLQASVLGQVVDSIRLLWPAVTVLGHRDTGAATLCPGLDIDTLRAQDWILTDVVYHQK